MFSIHRNATGETSRQFSWHTELTNRLGQVCLPSQTKDLLLEIVIPLDHFEWSLPRPANLKVAHSLGLGHTPPAIPYEDIKSQKVAEVVQVFLRAITLDRILWALGIGILPGPCIQYFHNDFDSATALTPLDMSHFKELLASMEQRLKLMNEGIDNTAYSGSTLGYKLLCGITSVKHEAAGTFHTMVSNLYYVATVMLLLLTSYGKGDPAKVEKTFKSVVPFHSIAL